MVSTLPFVILLHIGIGQYLATGSYFGKLDGRTEMIGKRFILSPCDGRAFFFSSSLLFFIS